MVAISYRRFPVLVWQLYCRTRERDGSTTAIPTILGFPTFLKEISP
jgi:hypothetical protein